VGLVLIEAGLRIAALTVGPRALRLEGPGGRRTILCLGDSHTYGVFYDEAEAYPGQLQRILDARAPGRYRVLNLGRPGMGTPRIYASMPTLTAVGAVKIGKMADHAGGVS
jgi:lysophospholipase L1-like esterase